MAMKGQRDIKNIALIPSVRTLVDSKLGGDYYRSLVAKANPTDHLAHQNPRFNIHLTSR
ncbi:hypothetical protein B296_00025989 [Ensete ventricosum]|uniref:Uncharacterized protein n=1 Tax=Ensete ventricosum TaxID=4639 RepID=A0A426ZUX1_ENSVE|nr:hypothetical protein B296_00025989 [Ensete ventricosum]